MPKWYLSEFKGIIKCFGKGEGSGKSGLVVIDGSVNLDYYIGNISFSSMIERIGFRD